MRDFQNIPEILPFSGFKMAERAGEVRSKIFNSSPCFRSGIYLLAVNDFCFDLITLHGFCKLFSEIAMGFIRTIFVIRQIFKSFISVIPSV